ncbi:scytonemin biosynthesis protein ScyA [Nostoc sphaeroides CHAB 2801]|uniref:scytonemin biosynthesis protein ScyA n=1 Tax=Nostoc sphaeroides TaxID=446679 RepID=UPI000E52AE0B|nr:scytonemin biosynthesis protein ScyA [Nostoc sphaeroides]MCC5629308.1 scytonemin biosynthesis protein ScyA [Nostoc sphaeroides CHAB 2801]
MSQNYTGSNSPLITTEPYRELPANRYVESVSDVSRQVDESENNRGIQPFLNDETPAALSVADAIAQMLVNLGVSYAFGVAGGAMASLWGALSNSSIDVLNFRHEAGAAFAATEAYFANNRPTVVFTTAGPGITNALTGLFAARGEGAKVILLSACTSAPQRGRWAIQETSTYTLPSGGIFTPGALFNYAITIESAAQLPQIFRKLALAMAQPGGFVAHLSIPTAVQTSLVDESISLPQLDVTPFPMTASKQAIAKSVELLSSGPFAIWVGFGARDAAEEIIELAERTGAAVMCSPRAKGIFPEDHPQFVGVTGLGGHASVLTYMEQQPPLRTLVLGTRLGEPTSFWSSALVPKEGFIHVDIDPEVPGVAYPHVETFAVRSDIKAFVEELLQQLPDAPDSTMPLPRPERKAIEPASEVDYPVRPEVLMAAIQKIIVEDTDAIVMAECGNSFTWSTHLLQFSEANRYRVSTGVGAMGHAVTGVLGAALASKSKAVGIVGDGAMLMNNEISTAVKYKIPAIWIVLNDARYNMCHQGMKILGLKGADATLPPTNFAMIARGMGAEAIVVLRESEIEAALQQAIASNAPFLLDVVIDADRPAPSGGRNKSLAAQGVKSSPASAAKQVSFPMV